MGASVYVCCTFIYIFLANLQIFGSLCVWYHRELKSLALCLGLAHLPTRKGCLQRAVVRIGDMEGVVGSVWTGVKGKVWLAVPCVSGKFPEGKPCTLHLRHACLRAFSLG